MNDQELEQMVRAGLTVPPQAGSEATVVVVIDGQPQTVPASVGIYMALNQLRQDQMGMLGSLGVLLDGIHHHLANKTAHPNSKQSRRCPTCLAIEQASKQGTNDVTVVAGNVGAAAAVQGTGESQEETE